MPDFEKGDKDIVKNYTPVSSLVVKDFERCVRASLFLACSNSLDSRQDGFLADGSCVTEMITFTEDQSSNMNEKSRIDIIYFLKASDSNCAKK